MKHQNKYLWGAMALSFVLTSAVIYIPVLSSAFGFERISALEYDVAIGLGLLVIRRSKSASGSGGNLLDKREKFA